MFKIKNKINDDVACVVLAAGESKRMGENKQFIPIDCENRPVLAYTLQNISRCRDISEIIVVTQSMHIKTVQDIVKDFGFNKVTKIIKGGNTRQQSAYNGAKEIAKNINIILLHDGARPFVNADNITKLIADVRKFKAATLGVKVKDTVKKLDTNGFVLKTLNREDIVNIHTPQGFSYDLYMSAIEYAIKNNLDFTDDAQLMENIGIKVFVTNDDYTNIKLTLPEDIQIARAMLKD